jgi:hypothetical protein
MIKKTDEIVASYLRNLKEAYPWARGENGKDIQNRGLALAEENARNACMGKLKLEGKMWDAALKENGFDVPAYSKKALAFFCGNL